MSSSGLVLLECLYRDSLRSTEASLVVVAFVLEANGCNGVATNKGRLSCLHSVDHLGHYPPTDASPRRANNTVGEIYLVFNEQSTRAAVTYAFLSGGLVHFA